MKFDEHLSAFLYENKSLRLEGIGTFTLDNKVSVNRDNEKEVYYPIEGLSFTYNSKSDTDENLILFLVKKLGKIQPLVRSDLESYLSNVKQFINIGKPYTIQGIGTLSKVNTGAYEFTPGSFLPVKEELHPHRENEEHNYPVRNESNAGKVATVILIVIAALAVLGGIGWGISSFLSKNNKQPVQEEAQQQGIVDTLPQPLQQDTASQMGANNVTTAPTDTATATMPVASDSARYKMIFEFTRSRNRAFYRIENLHHRHSYAKMDSLHIGDSLLYRLYLPLKIKMADSTHIKDSLKIFFGGKIKAERQ